MKPPGDGCRAGRSVQCSAVQRAVCVVQCNALELGGSAALKFAPKELDFQLALNGETLT